MKAHFMHNDRPVWRHEYKYRISRMTAEALSKIFLGLGLVRDPHADAKSGEYYVSSIYFDTPHLGDYYDKAGGFSFRKKIRGRIYSPWQNEISKEVKLEIKWRREQHISKDVVLLSHREWDMLVAGRYSELMSLSLHKNDAVNLKKSLWYLIRDSMHPVVFVRYLRRPFILHGDRILRVTLDHTITACETHNFWYTPFVTNVLPENEVVLEMKFSDVLPRWFRDIIYSFNLTRTSYSKYTASIDAVRLGRPLPR